jgi:hypothetical protein
MFNGKLSREYYGGLYMGDNSLHYVHNLWSLEGKRWDNDKMRWSKVLPYADVVYVAKNGDMWYYAPQNNVAMPIVRVGDRKIVYNLMESLGFDISQTDHNS